MSALLGLFIAPVCGLIIDYKADRGMNEFLFLCRIDHLFLNYQGHSQRLLNLSILQTLTWIATISLCIICMFRFIAVAIAAIFIFIFSRTMLVSGCQAVITTK